MATNVLHRASRCLGVLAVCVLAACNGASSAPSDGGSLASVEDAPSGVDASQVAALCSQVSAYSARCPDVSRCAQAQATYCTTWAPSFSAAFLAGLEACIAPPDCLDAGMLFPTQACFKAHLASPTPAQEKVKTDFCAQCPDGTSSSYPNACSEFFAVGVDDAGNSTTVGNAVLAVSDDLAATMDMQCTGAGAVDSGVSDCAVSFKNCVGAIVHYDANLPAPCTDVMAP
jgi:hypothetical protein